MNLVINGQMREAPDLVNVSDLARWLGLPASGWAVELEGRVVKRSDHGTTRVREGDRLEVIRLVGGG